MVRSLLYLLFSMLVGFVLALCSGKSVSSGDFATIATYSCILTFLSEQLLDLAYRLSKNTKLLEKQNRDLNHAITAMHVNEKILLPVAYQGRAAHEAYASTMSWFVNQAIFDDHTIYLSGPRVSKELYENFWSRIIDAQRIARDDGNKNPVKVYLTHASAVKPWITKYFSEIREAQIKFAAMGGQIYRLFLHNIKVRESAADYAEAISWLKREPDASSNTHLFYMRTDDDSELNDMDFLIVAFGGEFYCMRWQINGSPALVSGAVSACKISIDDRGFPKEFIGDWHQALRELEVSNPMKFLENDESLAKDTAERAEQLAILTARPTSDEWRQMLTY